MKRVINVFYPRWYGYADFVRGTAYMTKALDGVCNVGFSVEPPMGDLLAYSETIPEGVEINTSISSGFDHTVYAEYREQILEALTDRDVVYTTCSRYEPGKYAESIKRLFVLKPYYNDRFQMLFECLTQRLPYDVIHCRFGDNHLFGKACDYDLFSICLDLILEVRTPQSILVTDTYPFYAYVRGKIPDMLLVNAYHNARPVHSGNSIWSGPGVYTSENCFYTFCDFLLMTRARRIYCFSNLKQVYSGFSYAPAHLFGIPITVKAMKDKSRA
jgi:hypothetical protein